MEGTSSSPMDASSQLHTCTSADPSVIPARLRDRICPSSKATAHRPSNMATRLRKWAARSLLRNVTKQSEQRSVRSSKHASSSRSSRSKHALSSRSSPGEHASSSDASGTFSLHTEDTGEALETETDSQCSEECPFRGGIMDEAKIRPEFPEPEGDDGSLNSVAERLYTRINSLWQTRILRLLPGPVGSVLAGDLLVADIIMLPGLVLHDEERLVSFHALSYCCGEPLLTRRIRLNGELLPITENLYHALQILRGAHEPIFLWVDAICIHQNFLEEKSQQVANMLSIYRKASWVDIWLGASGKATGVAMECLSLGRDFMSYVHRHRYDLNIVLGGICELLSRPWFQRIWVKQELYAASNVFVHCGADVASGDVIADWTKAVELMLEMQNELRIDKTYSFEAHCQILQSFRRATPTELAQRDLPEQTNEEQSRECHLDIVNVLRRCAGSQCSEPQDHVYAVLGMTDVEHGARSAAYPADDALIIDYTKSTAEVFTDITRHVIARDCNLAILPSHSVCRSVDPMIDLPSWVPDFRIKQRPLLQYFREGRNTVLQQQYSMPAANHRRDEAYCLEIDHWHVPSSKLAVTGRRIGSIFHDKTLGNAESYEIDPTNGAWNIFHETHLYRHGVPDELLKRTETTLEAEVLAPDLETIATAVYQVTRESRNSACYAKGRDWSVRYALVNISWNSELLCSVAVSWSPSIAPASWGVVSTDQSTLVRCSYTAEVYQDLEFGEKSFERQTTSSWVVPSHAEKDDLIITATGSPLPMLIRPRSSTAWTYVGQAVPCQMKASEAFPSQMMDAINLPMRDIDEDLLEEFILE